MRSQCYSGIKTGTPANNCKNRKKGMRIIRKGEKQKNGTQRKANCFPTDKIREGRGSLHAETQRLGVWKY